MPHTKSQRFISSTVKIPLRNLKKNNQFRFDFGLASLLPEWRQLLARKYLSEDILAGLAVACVAVPLSLAIALASNVQPAVGLVSAIVAGIVCALFGGTPLAVSGPAAAMSILIAANVEQFGLGGLLVIGLICGLLQIVSGMFGVGTIAKFVPLPVVAGFTAGIGAIIFIGQLPRALGLPPPDQNHVFDVITHLSSLIHEMHPMVFAMTLLSMGLMRWLPLVHPRLPAPLFAVFVPTLIVTLFAIPDVPLVGSIPDSLPLPKLPDMPGTAALMPLIYSAIVVFAIGSLETLLSSSAVDKMIKDGKPHDPNQELIGQGMGNIFSALFGGIPVTGVIARSSLNVKAGAKTRRAAILHSFALIAIVYGFSQWMAQIPIAALAGVLLSVAINMLNPTEFRSIWRVSKLESGIYLITFLTIVFVDLLAGVQAGMITVILMTVMRMGRVQIHASESPTVHPLRVSVKGPLSFVASPQFEDLQRKLTSISKEQSIVIDLSEVDSMDTSGAASLEDLVGRLRQEGREVVVKGLQEKHAAMVFANNPSEWEENAVVSGEDEIKWRVSTPPFWLARGRLLHGYEMFRRQRNRSNSLYERLAEAQDPHTLFISCCDSRVNPNLMTSTDPGELFVLRNIGNVIPTPAEGKNSGEGAALEFALGCLNIGHIIICGHSNCGAVKAALSGQKLNDFPALDRWLEFVRPAVAGLPAGTPTDDAAKLNVAFQLQRLLSYPTVQKRIKEGKLMVQGWFYDVARREIWEWSTEQQAFVALKMGVGYLAGQHSPLDPPSAEKSKLN